MTPWPRFLRVLRSLAGRGPIDRDLDLEVAACVELLAEEKMAAGASREEALRQAKIELGGVEQVKEEVRAGRPAAWLDTLARDVRFGLRVLAKTPAFSLAAIAIVGLGVGANAAVFGLVNVLLFQPPPGEERGRPVGVYSHDPKTPDSYRDFSYAEYEIVRGQAGVFDQVMAHRSTRVVLTDQAGSRRAEAALVSGNYFSTLGVRLAAGRSFTSDEERPGSEAPVAVLSDAAWRSLGGGPGVLGRTLVINSHPFTVVGIAPPGFAGPTVAFGPQVWLPVGAEPLVTDGAAAGLPSPGDRGRRNLRLVGTLREGVSVAAAGAALGGVERRFRQDDPVRNERQRVSVHPLARTEDGSSPGDDSGLLAPLGTLAGLALVLLVVASLNVANMQLARHATRRKEIAMRLALGAGRARVVQQLLVEGLLLALAGGAAGLVIGLWTLKLVVLSFTPMIEQATAIVLAPDRRLLLATFGYSALSALVFAVAPAFRLVRAGRLADLRSASRDGGGDHGRIGPRHLLVGAQVALSLSLLAAAGLFVRAALAAASADPGYRLEGQLLARVDASGLSEVQGRESFRRVVDRVRAMPGVASASVASLVSFGNESTGRPVRNADTTPEADAPGSGAVLAQNSIIGAAYFQTLGLPLLRGREFTDVEEREPGTSRVAIVDEPLAAALFPGEDPLGRHLSFASSRARPDDTLEIVGVVPGLRHRLTDRGPVPHVYQPVGAFYQARLNVHVRQAVAGSAETAVMLRELRRAIREADARLAVIGVSPLSAARDGSPLNWLVRAAGQVFGALGVIALGMAVTGLYGVKAYLVARRRREIGIRMALGATGESVIALILKDGARVLGAGVAIGFVLALGAGQIVSRLLVGVKPLDPLVLVVSTAVLSLAVLMASYVPARRATRVDPALVLRDE